MAHLIDKSALVAEIKKLEKLYCYDKSDGMLIAKSVFDSIKNIINTFEVRDVDLEKEIPMWIKENPRERSFDDGWFIGMDDCLHRNGYKIKICDLWNLPKEPFNSKDFETI